MLWGYSIEFWNRAMTVAIWVAFIGGGVGLAAGLFTGVVGQQLTTISEREAATKIAAAHAKSAEANEKAKVAELKLEQLRRDVGPRQLNRASFLAALAGQAHVPVEIFFLRDDPECFDLAQQLRVALTDAGWNPGVLRPIPQPDGRNADPAAMAIDGQPSGVTVVVSAISEAEASATQNQMLGRDWVRTPWTVLSFAVQQGLGKVGGHAGGPNAPPQGTLRLVVAPR